MFVDIQEAPVFRRRETEGIAQEAVGIDFGTTHCVVAFCPQETEVLVLGYEHLDKGLIRCSVDSRTGQVGTVESEGEKNFVISSVKRKMALDPEAEMDGQNVFSLAVRVFNHLKDHIDRTLGRPIHHAVVTVPAHFDEVRRADIRKAARAAGFDVLRLLTEPTAAAIAYGILEKSQGLYGVYDLGGGTFDFSLLDMTQGIFHVRAVGGDPFLGGDDIDEAFARALWQDGESAWDALSESHRKPYIFQARVLKEKLSEQGEDFPVEKEILAKIATPFLQQTLRMCQETLVEKALGWADLQGVILVGGSTRMPFVVDFLRSAIDCPVTTSLHPEYAVAWGAAQYAYQLTHGRSFLLLDVCPLSLGVEVFGGMVERLIPRNAPLPAQNAYDFTTAQDGQTAMSIHIVQGEREFAKDCRSLGRFDLRGIRPALKGAACISVQFSLDVDGLLTVEAWEKSDRSPDASQGPRMRLQVNGRAGLTDEILAQALEDQRRQDGQDVVERVWVQKTQQVLEAVSEVRRFLSKKPDLFTPQEHGFLHQWCDEMVTLTQDPSQERPLSDLNTKWDSFSQEVLPFLERYLTSIFQETFDAQD